MRQIFVCKQNFVINNIHGFIYFLLFANFDVDPKRSFYEGRKKEIAQLSS